jgi:hypothetical protein
MGVGGAGGGGEEQAAQIIRGTAVARVIDLVNIG